MRTVLTQLEDGLATVTLNRPERLNGGVRRPGASAPPPQRRP